VQNRISNILHDAGLGKYSAPTARRWAQ